MFKGLGVNIVHLAEFHGDGHPREPGPVFDCGELQMDVPGVRSPFGRRDPVFLPGEEANSYLGMLAARQREGRALALSISESQSTGR